MFQLKKGQITIFIIIGVIIIMGFMLINFDNQDKKKSFEEFTDSGFNEVTNYINEYLSGCINVILDKGIAKIGYKDNHFNFRKYSDIEMYMNNDLPNCIEKLNELNYANITYSNPDTDIRLSEDEKELLVEVNFPLYINKGDKLTKISIFTYTYPLITNMKLNIENNILKNEILFSSSDSRIQLNIPKGTKLSDNINNISIYIRDKTDLFFYDDPSIGEVVYEMSPNNLKFDPPIELIYAYEDDMISDKEESELKYYYYNEGNLEEYPSIINTEANTINAEIDQFTKYLTYIK